MTSQAYIFIEEGKHRKNKQLNKITHQRISKGDICTVNGTELEGASSMVGCLKTLVVING